MHETTTSPNLIGPAPREDLAVDRSRINFSWYLHLRWAAVIGQVVTIATVALLLRAALPLTAFGVLIGVQIILNLILGAWFQRHSGSGTTASSTWAAQGELALGSIMAIDIAFLTALLFVSGGPTNPFGIFYLVNLALAAVVLKTVWTWILTGLTLLSYLFLLHDYCSLPELGSISGDLVSRLLTDPRSLDAVNLYHGGKFVALGAVSAILVYFITRVTAELSRLEHVLGHIRNQRAHTEKMEALGTLAAGAAHELSSPLSTIAVVARDLEVETDRGSAGRTALDDVKLIRTEVERCRQILDQMAMGAGQATGEESVDLGVDEVISRVLDGIREKARVDTVVFDSARDASVHVPPRALVHAVRAVVKNALDASAGDLRVAVECGVSKGFLRVSVRDRGTGMSAEVFTRAGLPFFTTKEPGEGMGLGLFLSRAVIERLGGSLRIHSVPEAGTSAVISIPAGDHGRE